MIHDLGQALDVLAVATPEREPDAARGGARTQSGAGHPEPDLAVALGYWSLLGHRRSELVPLAMAHFALALRRQVGEEKAGELLQEVAR